MVARGAKRPRSELRGAAAGVPAARAVVGGRGASSRRSQGRMARRLAAAGRRARCCAAFYLNELLLKLLPREDPHPAAVATTTRRRLQALAGDARPAAQAVVLRRFEVRLLAELGYALPLTHEVDTGAPIDPAARYHYAFDRGPRRMRGRAAARAGRSCAARRCSRLPTQRYPDAETAAEAKRLMRDVLDHYLESAAHRQPPRRARPAGARRRQRDAMTNGDPA